MKHIIAIIIVLAIIIVTTVVLLPKIGESELTQAPAQKDESSVEETVAEPIVDTLPFKEYLQQELQVVQAEFKSRKNKHIWTLGRGQSIITYLLQAQRFVNKKGGKILYMEELHNTRVLQAANLDILQPDQDTLHLELQVSESVFRDDASMLAIAFEVTSLTPELVAELNRLDYPFSLLIPPFGMKSESYSNLDHVNQAELELWIAMEDTSLNKSHNKLRPLRIHHTEEQIQNVIDDAKSLFPKAKGVVSRFGQQAVEHEQLLQAILKPAKKNDLWFVDATMNSRSKLSEVCQKLSMNCKVTSCYTPENSTLNDYLKQQLRNARKRGLSTMEIPLTKENLNKVKDLSEKAQKQGTSLVYLSKFMEY